MAPPLGSTIPGGGSRPMPQQHRSNSVSKVLPPTRAVSYAPTQQRASSAIRPSAQRWSQEHPPYSSREYPHFIAEEEPTRGIRPRPPPANVPKSVQYHREGSYESNERITYAMRERPASTARVINSAPRHPSPPSRQHRSISAPRPNVESPVLRKSILSPQSSPEEVRATANIQKAEAKIDGLLQELEDLRFLEEIDLQDATPPMARSKSAPRTAIRELPLKTPRGDTIPSIVRAISPPVPKKNEPSMVQLLSPRVIGKMDRMALELETQTLCRKVDVLAKEKATLEKAVEMYESSLQDQERESSQQLQQMEQDVLQLRQQLQQTQRDVRTVREQVTADYDGRLQETVTKLQRTQQAADQYRQERGTLQQELEQLRGEYQESQRRAHEDEVRSRGQQQQRIQELEQQLQEVADLADELKEQYEGEQAVTRQLERQLRDEQSAREASVTQAQTEWQQQQQQFQVELRRQQQEWQQERAEHQREVTQLKEQLVRQEEREQDQDAALRELQEQKEQQLRQFQTQCSEQTQIIQDMTERLDAVHTEYRDKFVELKEAYESKEKRRFQEMEQAHGEEMEARERQLQALQEQLRHQSDRHGAEMELKARALQNTVEVHDKESRQREQEHVQLRSVLEEKLVQLQMEYDSVDRERRRLQQELEQETTRLQEKQKSLLRESAEKTERIRELSQLRIEADQRHEQKIRQLQNEHSKALLQREKELTEPMQQMRTNEVQLRCDLDRLQADRAEMQQRLESRVRELREELDVATQEMNATRRRNEETESQLRGELSVLEGKLRGAEAILKQKNDALDDLKEKLELSTNQEIAATEEYREEAQRLEKEILDLKQQLEKERSGFNSKLLQLEENLRDKANLVNKLEAALSSASTKEESMDQRMKEMEATCREAKAELIAERTRHASTEEQTRVDLAVLQGKYRASEASLKEKRETIDDLEDQLRRIADESSTTNKEQQKELEQLRSEVKKLNDQIDQDRAELFTKGELLKQQQKKLRETADEIVRLQQTIATSTQLEESRARDISKLESALEQATSELESERVDKVNAVFGLQQQLDSGTAKVRDLEAELDSKQQSIADIEDKLRSALNQSSISVKEYQSKLDEQRQVANERLEEEIAKNRNQTAQVEELQTRIAELVGMSQRVTELEHQLSVASKTEQSLRDELETVRVEHTQTSRSLQTELTVQREKENATIAKIAELEEKLRESTLDIEKKQALITDLRFKAQNDCLDSATMTTQLKSEINSLRYDIKMSNDLLQKERSAMDLKVEEYEQLKVLNWNLRQKASRVENLENIVAELRAELENSASEKANQSIEISAENSAVVLDLRSQLEVERKAKEDLMTKLVDTEAELEIKQHQLSRLPSLQAQLKLLVDEREDLHRQLDRLESEQEQKEVQISASSDNVADDRIANLEAELFESKNHQAQLQAKLLTVELDVGRIQQLLKEKATLEAKIRELEEDREEREKQVRESSDRYSNQILQLQIQVEELLRKKTSLKTRLSRLEVDLESKDEQMSVASSQFSGDVSNYQSILIDRLAENEALKARLNDMESKLSEVGSAEEIQLKLDAESREKRSLLSRIGDIEAELQRKEKQIRDIVDRYTRDIAELEYKLEDELKTKAALQKEVDKLKRGESTFVDKDLFKDTTQLAELTKTNAELREELKKVSMDAEKSKQRLEEQLDALISNQDEFSGRKELEDKLHSVEKSKAELEERLKKVNSERAEVIKALEEVINEVQSREDEIEGLATVLRKRDEELEHAKLIATKALASAQEMKARMKGKTDDRQSELSQKVEELNSSIEFLTKKNESLERATSRMERELQQRELECGELRNKLTVRKKTDKPSVTGKFDEKIDNDGFHSISADFPTFDTASPTTRASSGLMMNESMSMESGEPQVASGWLHDFDSHSTDDSEDDANVSFLGIHTTPSDSQRRSIERDALRKYVRKRYMKSKVSA